MANVLRFDFKAPHTQALEKIRSIVSAGGVVAFPTDTFYGLGADPFNPDALSKIFRIKQRPADKPLLILIHSVDQLDRLTVEVTANARKLMERFWPGPLTLIFKASPHLPEALTAGTGTIGIRLPDNTFTRRLLEELGHPLTAPSANISGDKEPVTAKEVADALKKGLDLIVDGGPAPGGEPSTILDTTTETPTLLRGGAILRAELEAVLPIQTL